MQGPWHLHVCHLHMHPPMRAHLPHRVGGGARAQAARGERHGKGPQKLKPPTHERVCLLMMCAELVEARVRRLRVGSGMARA